MAMVNMKAKLKRMMTILNQNKHRRKYVCKCIDMGDSGYYRINPWYDVEINPSCIPKEDTASLFLWLCYDTPDGKRCSIVAACARRVPFDKLDDVVQEWVKQINKRQLLSHMEQSRTVEELYDVCALPNKPVNP